jgi:hypothetical protein
MKKEWLWTSVIVFGGFLSGCDWESSGPERLRDAYGTSCVQEDATQRDINLGEVTPQDNIAGTYAMLVVQKATLETPLACPSDNKCDLEIRDFLLARVSAERQALYMEFCDQKSKVSGGSGMNPESGITQGLRDARIFVIKGFGKVADKDKIPALDGIVWLWGVKDLVDLQKDPLPEDANDKHVFDQDSDGKPGVTIEVTSPLQGERYMVRRAIWSLGEGQLQQDGLTINGEVKSFSIEEKAIGASNGMPVQPSTIEQASDKPSTFILKRISDSSTCDYVRQASEVLFSEPTPSGAE